MTGGTTSDGTADPGGREPDAIDLALPWHVVERLPPDEAARVAAALAADPERARHLAIVREERAETVALNQDLGLPSIAARDALFARIDTERGAARRAGLGARLRGLFAGLSPGALAWSSAAAALVIALQAGFLAKSYLGADGPGYETASAPGAAATDGSFALVAFAATANAEQIEALLRASRASIVDGPRAGGLYRIRLGDRTMAAAEREAAIDRLKAAGGVVRLVAPETPPAP